MAGKPYKAEADKENIQFRVYLTAQQVSSFKAMAKDLNVKPATLGREILKDALEKWNDRLKKQQEFDRKTIGIRQKSIGIH